LLLFIPETNEYSCADSPLKDICIEYTPDRRGKSENVLPRGLEELIERELGRTHLSMITPVLLLEQIIFTVTAELGTLLRVRERNPRTFTDDLTDVTFGWTFTILQQAVLKDSLLDNVSARDMTEPTGEAVTI
jgi:hypothetical protein